MLINKALLRTHKPVADSGLRQYMNRLRRIKLQLMAQVTHINPQVVLVLHISRSPYFAQQLLMRDHSPGMTY